jgi:hypothetical protein
VDVREPLLARASSATADWKSFGASAVETAARLESRMLVQSSDRLAEWRTVDSIGKKV